jgi:very-short-patch-repair endonuclease
MNESEKKKKVASILRKVKRKAKRNPYTKAKYLKSQSKKMENKKTWPEKEFESILNEMKITYESQKIIKGKIFDYYIPEMNTVCEVDGDYYHANPEKYEQLNEMQKRNVKNDNYKSLIAKGLGYSIFRVWESELKESRERVIERIKKEILKIQEL